jgi:hypothetical protein
MVKIGYKGGGMGVGNKYQYPKMASSVLDLVGVVD